MAQRSMRPDLVTGDGFVAVLFHTVDAQGNRRTAGNAVAVSFDRGATWAGPRPVNRSRWRINPIIAVYNGPGLRDRARAARRRPDDLLRLRRRPRRPLVGVRRPDPRHAAAVADARPDPDPGPRRPLPRPPDAGRRSAPGRHCREDRIGRRFSAVPDGRWSESLDFAARRMRGAPRLGHGTSGTSETEPRCPAVGSAPRRSPPGRGGDACGLTSPEHRAQHSKRSLSAL